MSIEVRRPLQPIAAEIDRLQERLDTLLVYPDDTFGEHAVVFLNSNVAHTVAMKVDREKWACTFLGTKFNSWADMIVYFKPYRITYLDGDPTEIYFEEKSL